MYGVDLDDPAVRPRSWRWFAVRLNGLLSRPPSTYVPIALDEKTTRPNVPVWLTRVQTALLGHPLDK